MKERNKTNRRKENKKYNILKKYIFFLYIYIYKEDTHDSNFI